MNAMQLCRKTERFEPPAFGSVALFHRCPVCDKEHEVPEARAQFAYGGQLTCGPDCEVERRRRSRAAYRAMSSQGVSEMAPAVFRPEPAGSRDERDARAQGTLHLVNGARPKVVLSITGESIDLLHVRRAVFQSVGESVDVMKAVPVPHSSKARLFVSVKADALDAMRSAIMRAVRAGEFGRVHCAA